jgi:DNA-directed RNA polymerase specialized sigma24 family protein
MTDYRVTVTVKNARILRAMEKAGFDSVAALARAMNISTTTLHMLLSLRRSPLSRGRGPKGDNSNRPLRWIPTVEKLSFILKVPVDELFSPAQRNPSGSLTRKSVDVSEADVHAYISSASASAPMLEDGLIKKDTLRKIIIEAKLDPREDEIIAGTFFEDKYSPDFAEKFGISTARSDQIRNRALRKLKSAADRLHVSSIGLFK